MKLSAKNLDVRKAAEISVCLNGRRMFFNLDIDIKTLSVDEYSEILKMIILEKILNGDVVLDFESIEKDKNSIIIFRRHLGFLSAAFTLSNFNNLSTAYKKAFDFVVKNFPETICG